MSSQDSQTASQDATPTKTYDEEGLRLTKRVNALHRLVAYTRIIIRVIQLAAAYFPLSSVLTNNRIISILMTLDTLAQYYSTASLYQGGKYLWPAPTETNFAPTLLTLGEALITLVLCSIVLISYSHGIAAADQWDGRREFFDKCVSGLTFILSASAAGTMFQTGNDIGSSTKSLWEFVCNATSEQQSFWYQYFDYGTFCLMQVSSFL